MKKVFKKIYSIVMLSALFTFNLISYVHADVIDPGYIRPDIDDISNKSLLKIIIILITIILFMGVGIIKYLYSRYKVELKIVRKDEEPANHNVDNLSYSFAGNEVGSSIESEMSENNSESSKEESNNQEYNDNIKIELDMKKLFAGMLIVVAVLIIVGFVF